MEIQYKNAIKTMLYKIRLWNYSLQGTIPSSVLSCEMCWTLIVQTAFLPPELQSCLKQKLSDWEFQGKERLLLSFCFLWLPKVFCPLFNTSSAISPSPPFSSLFLQFSLALFYLALHPPTMICSCLYPVPQYPLCWTWTLPCILSSTIYSYNLLFHLRF